MTECVEFTGSRDITSALPDVYWHVLAELSPHMVPADVREQFEYLRSEMEQTTCDEDGESGNYRFADWVPESRIELACQAYFDVTNALLREANLALDEKKRALAEEAAANEAEFRAAMFAVALGVPYQAPDPKAAAEAALAEKRRRVLEAWTPPPGYRLH